MLRPQPNRLVSAVLLLSALMVFGCSEAAEAGAREAITLDFDATTVGELPAGFSTAVTGGGGPAVWRVVEDASAPSGGKVLAQTSTDQTSSRFPLCIYEGLTAADVEVSVRFKPVAGTVDQAAGLVVRYRDKEQLLHRPRQRPGRQREALQGRTGPAHAVRRHGREDASQRLADPRMGGEGHPFPGALE